VSHTHSHTITIANRSPSLPPTPSFFSFSLFLSFSPFDSFSPSLLPSLPRGTARGHSVQSLKVITQVCDQLLKGREFNTHSQTFSNPVSKFEADVKRVLIDPDSYRL
jgi:hypothetical protein